MKFNCKKLTLNPFLLQESLKYTTCITFCVM